MIAMKDALGRAKAEIEAGGRAVTKLSPGVVVFVVSCCLSVKRTVQDALYGLHKHREHGNQLGKLGESGSTNTSPDSCFCSRFPTSLHSMSCLRRLFSSMNQRRKKMEVRVACRRTSSIPLASSVNIKTVTNDGDR